MRRDQKERDALVFRQIEERKSLLARMQRLDDFAERKAQEIESDLKQYRDIEQRKRDLFELRKERQSRGHDHERGPKHEL